MSSRKQKLLDRLRKKLRNKTASLADEFEYKMYILIIYKDPKADPLVYEAEKVALWMTNNGEEDMMNDMKHKSEEVKDLIQRDTVQIHAMRWVALNSRTMEPVKNMDLKVWPNPNNNIAGIEALCFSRWKGPRRNKDPYKLLAQRFVIRYFTIRRHVKEIMLPSHINPRSVPKRRREICFNPGLNFAVWISKRKLAQNKIEARLTSVMLCVQQAELTQWTKEAYFVDRLNFEKVTEFQMMLWKDLALRSKESNETDGRLIGGELGAHSPRPDGISILPEKKSKRVGKEAKDDHVNEPLSTESLSKALSTLGSGGIKKPEKSRLDKAAGGRTPEQIEAENIGRFDAMRFIVHTTPSQRRKHSSSNSSKKSSSNSSKKVLS
mmetsp:Transcript_28096/g.68312  ORF Transcript_28096/g.68312 Transcript_28096/m.68312 type:complete len:379 (-) Transcript_28096:341-1477(-)